jgi:hypothetical protein
MQICAIFIDMQVFMIDLFCHHGHTLHTIGLYPSCISFLVRFIVVVGVMLMKRARTKHSQKEGFAIAGGPSKEEDLQRSEKKPALTRDVVQITQVFSRYVSPLVTTITCIYQGMEGSIVQIWTLDLRHRKA